MYGSAKKKRECFAKTCCIVLPFPLYLHLEITSIKKMELTFSIRYRTHWGESIAVEIETERGGTARGQSLLPLTTGDGESWTGHFTLPAPDVRRFKYRYVVVRDGRVTRREWDAVPRNFPANDGLEFIFPDYWRDAPEQSHLYSSAYVHSVTPFTPCRSSFVYYGRTIIFRVLAPQLSAGQVLALVGSQASLGGWNAGQAMRMQGCGANEWVLSLNADGLQMPFEYKYVVLDEQSGEVLEWEQGANRQSPSTPLPPSTVLAVCDHDLRLPERHWRVAGVVIPVFSLRSQGSQGVGDFGDLAHMADLAAETGMHAVQLLPIYDTTQTHTWSDCYPYSAISIYALHPMYTDLRQLPRLDSEAAMSRFKARAAALNALPQMDYEGANSLKHDYLHALYAQEGAATLASDGYRRFYADNEDWLMPYTAFCLLRDRYGTCDFTSWPEHSQYDPGKARSLVEQHAAESGYYAYVQYLLDGQLRRASAHAHGRGVWLKGDIPIGISRCSVEAWTAPGLFHMDGQAGAPPDAFSTTGQNWGFPTYNWEAMAADGYLWWRRRLERMSRYFDAFRIDHVLGFFRIWQIPLCCVDGLLGHFSPSLPMSREEIEGFGLHFRREFMTKPYITDHIIDTLFADQAGWVREHCLERQADGHYRLCGHLATQRQILEQFPEGGDERSRQLRTGLFRLTSQVLFIPDEDAPDRYHPRIGADSEFIFRALSPEEQESFRHLHHHYFHERHNQYWEEHAMRVLPVLVQATHMLVCAEDLGMVPQCVAPVLERLRILTLEIQTMPKTYGQLFANLDNNPHRSVCTIFTHDMPTLRGWWQEEPERAQLYFRHVLHHDGQAPADMPGWLCREVVERHLASPSMLCLLSLQDWLSTDEHLRNPAPTAERINIPANPHHYWRYRMHLTLEQLSSARDFCQALRSMTAQSGRL